MEMFADLAVPCLGLVENMAGVVCDHCGRESVLFGAGGATDLADQTGLPLLARLAFFPNLATASDAGRPTILDDPDSASSAQFHALARQLAGHLERQVGTAGRPDPSRVLAHPSGATGLQNHGLDRPGGLGLDGRLLFAAPGE